MNIELFMTRTLSQNQRKISHLNCCPLPNPLAADSILKLDFTTTGQDTIVHTSAGSWALYHNGDPNYGPDGTIDNFGKGKPKCNKFVRDAYVKGAQVKYPHYKRGLIRSVMGKEAWPVRANDMADPSLDAKTCPGIEDYPVVEEGQLKVRDIISFPVTDGTGHMAIYVGGDKIIQAGYTAGKVVITNITDTSGYGNMFVRRYEP